MLDDETPEQRIVLEAEEETGYRLHDVRKVFEAFLAELSTDGFDARIASGGGRQYITMDRYDANWPMVERGWKTHVLGQGTQFANATEAVSYLGVDILKALVLSVHVFECCPHLERAGLHAASMSRQATLTAAAAKATTKTRKTAA